MSRPRLVMWLVLPVILPLLFVLVLPFVPPAGQPPVVHPVAVTRHPPSTLPLTGTVLGSAPGYRPLIPHVQIVDLDQDGRLDVLACDARRQRVLWYRQLPSGNYQETPLGDEIGVPAHTTVVDLDGDGRLDVLVSVLGSVWPSDQSIGRVVLLRNRGDRFTNEVLLDGLRRVTDVQAGDLDGDSDVDLAVAEFGYDHGRILWMENRGSGRFRERTLLAAAGGIHVPLADYDGDGDLDIVALISQEDEDVWALENQGNGTFTPHLIHSDLNFDLGSVGLVLTDLDRDDRPDLLLAIGDNLEVRYPVGQTWHGCVWLRNLGGWKFEPRKIGQLAGTYSVAAGDLDGDGDLDVVLGSMFNDWRRPESGSLVWLENDGRQNFSPWQIANRPTHLTSVACGDLNRDGRADIVAGSAHLLEPFDRLGRVTLWLSEPRNGP